jgi:hypothetical protein
MDPVPTKINDGKLASTLTSESYLKIRKKILNSWRLIIFMVMYFSVKNCADPLVNPNNFTLNCPFKNSTLHLKNTNVVSGSDPDHGPRAAFGPDRNLEFCLDLHRWSGHNVGAGPDPDHRPPAAADPDPDLVPCQDLPKAIRWCGPDTDSEPFITSGSDPGPGPVLDKDLFFCSDPYSGRREISLKFYFTLNRLIYKTCGIISSNYSYLTLYLRRSRDMDELDEYMRWLEGDDGAMDNIRNQQTNRVASYRRHPGSRRQ